MAKDLIGATYSFEDIEIDSLDTSGSILATGTAYVTRDGDSTWTDPDSVSFTRLSGIWPDLGEIVDLDFSAMPEEQLASYRDAVAVNLDAKGLASWLAEQLDD